MSSWHIIIPVVLPFALALFSLAFRKPSPSRRVTLVIGILFLLLNNSFLLKQTLSHGWLIHYMGGWAAPYGIVLSVDVFSSLMLLLTSIVGFICLLFGFIETSIKNENPLRCPLFFFLLAGIDMSFVTGDLFNLYVSFEVMLLSSYALMTLEADNWHTKHAYSYVTLNLFASALFLIGAGLIYGSVGTLNFADIAARSTVTQNTDFVFLFAACTLTLVFAMKAGVFPLYYWLPKSYPTLSTPLGAFYGGLLTKVGVYSLVRLFYTVLPQDMTLPHHFILWISVPTMIFGVIGAVSMGFTRGILSYHIISQVGFILLALGFFTPLSLIACVFYIVHHIIVKSSLFLLGGIGFILNRTDDLQQTGGLWRAVPWLGILFILQALSLGGLPPLSGFWGKYMIVLDGLQNHRFIFVAASLVASLLTLVSMLKIWFAVFWQEAPSEQSKNFNDPRKKPLLIVCTLMVMTSLFIGFYPKPLMKIAETASQQLINQKAYIDLVLNHKDSQDTSKEQQ